MSIPWKTFLIPHDPDSTLIRSFPFLLPAGVGLAAATLTEVVGGDPDDPASSVPVVSATLSLSAAVVGQVEGALWGATFTPTGGTSGATHWIQCRATLSTGEVTDYTCGLRCQET